MWQTWGAIGVRRSLAAQLFGIALAVAALKTFLYFVDPMPSFFMGDSGTYLTTALEKFFPPDRSYTYGWLVRVFAVRQFHSLHALVVFQTVLGGLSSLLLAGCLLRIFRAPFAVALCAALLFAIEPLQWTSEHFVLTEAVAGFLLAVYLACVFDYVKWPDIWKLIRLPLIGFWLISVRMSSLPLMILLSGLLPVSAMWRGWKRGGVRALVLHLAISVCWTQGVLYGYRKWNGHLAKRPSAYLYANGFFLVTSWAPIIRPEDFPIAALRAGIFERPEYPLENRALRPLQHWRTQGLVGRIVMRTPDFTAYPDNYVANLAATETAMHAAKRDPWGLVKLTAQTFGDYWNRNLLDASIVENQGFDRDLYPNFPRMVQQRFYVHYDADESYNSASKRWARWVTGWYYVLLVSPLLVGVGLFVAPRDDQGAWSVLLIGACVFVGIASGLVEKPTVRYLQPLGWIVLLAAGAGAGYALRWFETLFKHNATRRQEMVKRDGKG